MSNKKLHRGRFQAQGGGLEESESWAQDKPLTAKQGLRLLGRLKDRLTTKEQKKREQQFAKMEKLIKRMEKNGGIDARYDQSYRNTDYKGVRVDLEVLGGKAFVCLTIVILILYWLFF